MLVTIFVVVVLDYVLVLSMPTASQLFDRPFEFQRVLFMGPVNL